MTGEAPHYLFVYGTLMRGSKSPSAKLLAARAKFAGEASAPGRLYRFAGFPGAIFDERCRTHVHGELFRLNGAAILDALDAYEGCCPDVHPALFRRDVIRVRLARRGTLTAWAYPFAGEVAGRPVIASGRFLLREGGG